MSTAPSISSHASPKFSSHRRFHDLIMRGTMCGYVALPSYVVVGAHELDTAARRTTRNTCELCIGSSKTSTSWETVCPPPYDSNSSSRRMFCRYDTEVRLREGAVTFISRLWISTESLEYENGRKKLLQCTHIITVPSVLGWDSLRRASVCSSRPFIFLFRIQFDFTIFLIHPRVRIANPQL